MSDIVERVARAIYEHENRAPARAAEWRNVWNDGRIWDGKPSVYAARARAAIAAMREPTEAMRDAGDTWAEGHSAVQANENIAAAWRSMIDAALAGAGGEG